MFVVYQRRRTAVRRRNLLRTGVSAASILAMPRSGRADRQNKLVFVPTNDLAVLDPVVTFARPTRNHGYLVFDTLYGIDTNWRAQPQMVEGHLVEHDGLTWTLTLREGLRFHDGTPVLGHDVVASIGRFAQRIAFAAALMMATDELSAPDDRTIRFRLKRPFPHLPDALAGPGGNAPVIMPERLATTSPFKPVTEIVGSGPYRFLPNEHVSGAHAAYERFPQYQPRSSGTAGFTSGPKFAHFDRIEWLTLDPVSAMEALRTGEIDWWESTLRDVVEPLSRDPALTVVSHYATTMGILRFNHLFAPFDNAEIRRALLGAIDQGEAMTAVADINRVNWIDGVGLFPTGTPLANEEGIDIMRAPRDYGAVRQALARAGYKGETVVVVAPADLPGMQALSVVGSDQLRRAGMNVDLQEMDAGTALRRRLSEQPPDKGGWNAFFYLLDRSTPTTNPFGNPAIRADGRAGWDGWPSSARIEALRADWLNASSLQEEQRICMELQRQCWRDVPYIPMGEFWQATAYRKDLADVVSGCFPVFWGVRRI
jgi:peptide/nickel transport system substrate-binding protein